MDKQFKNSLFISCGFACVLWWVKLTEIFFGWSFADFGVTPHQPLGLIGILTAPLIHGSLNHIFSNTLPTILLGTLLIYGYPQSWKRVLTIIWLGSGIGVWLYARDATHIGASGLSHGVFFFLFIASIFRRDKRSVAIMMIGFFMYGGMTMSIFPRSETISFEYHLYGALFGSLCALMYWRVDQKPVEKRYQWEGQPELDDPIIGDEWQQVDGTDNPDQLH
ncbi:rhomboid family intramembrane serine protease [Alteromonadaceae bacterium BrNp21-10]|nr:rhomboid family intramembrane serine protease [Alteromonadaceae bacterium BrNp21-10]